MKLFSLTAAVLTIFASISVLAFVPQFEGFRCIPSVRQTRLQVVATPDRVELTVVNPSGYEFMPQFEGSTSLFNLNFQKMQGEDLKPLGDSFKFTWKKDQCVLNSEEITLNCQGEAAQAVGAVKAYGVSTTKITEEYGTDTYKKRRFRLATENQNTYFVNLEFYLQNCEKF